MYFYYFRSNLMQNIRVTKAMARNNNLIKLNVYGRRSFVRQKDCKMTSDN